jgi:hypothetical protein
MNIGVVERFQRRYSEALQSEQQAFAIFQQLGEAVNAAAVSNTIKQIQALIDRTASPSPTLPY